MYWQLAIAVLQPQQSGGVSLNFYVSIIFLRIYFGKDINLVRTQRDHVLCVASPNAACSAHYSMVIEYAKEAYL